MNSLRRGAALCGGSAVAALAGKSRISVMVLAGSRLSRRRLLLLA
jgi:hypothetical protein